MKHINMKVVLFSDIPKEISEDTYLESLPSNVYTEFYLPSEDELDAKDYDLSDTDIWLRENYPQLIGTTFLIEKN